MLGEYCRNYRKDKGATLREVEGNESIKALSAFEMGRSSNIAHFFKYVALSIKHGEFHSFINGAIDAMNKGE